jgi:hypothetical protein
MLAACTATAMPAELVAAVRRYVEGASHLAMRQSRVPA